MPESVSGLFGIAAIFAIAFALSTNRRAISLRIVLSAFAIQVGIAVLVMHVPIGRAAIDAMSTGISQLLAYSQAGIGMVFGPLASVEENGVIFAVLVLPVIVFFASLMSVLYYIGVMQWVVAGLGRLLHWVLGTGRVESLNASANIFVGQTEAPLVVRPYLAGLTQPQLFAVMTSGLASVAGSVLAAYAQMGIPVEYLLAASFMSAPGGLLMAKLIMPDAKDHSAKQDLIEVKLPRDEHSNVIMAAAIGAKDGLHLALNVGAMLIAFVSLIALLNGIIGGIAGLFGIDGLTIQSILGWIFAPLMYVLSIPWSEAQAAGAILGEKIILNEFVAYLSLTGAESEFSPRSLAVLTFALCGFANLSSVGILLGGLGSLIPDRMGEIARFGLRAVAAGTLSNLMSAAIAGILFVGA
ncbi:NupC/NupG family nucleoside CNT transporter [Hyphobacterium sp. SN044]|uniref:NupC/NupG family nucleoside CNT transporter n=1 Tax=Hyphobacterium sp. SN044 TaxID=2912575 RepID=UPI001EFF6F4F|nr:NupC/NupG family nucleoside CNT transporter [Hyphobacterium sp. SN044]MCF8880021.1 NupC/NupG family nucleoside CNT transporter [Hyphobacterium sp. SN044]